MLGPGIHIRYNDQKCIYACIQPTFLLNVYNTIKPFQHDCVSIFLYSLIL